MPKIKRAETKMSFILSEICNIPFQYKWEEDIGTFCVLANYRFTLLIFSTLEFIFRPFLLIVPFLYASAAATVTSFVGSDAFNSSITIHLLKHEICIVVVACFPTILPSHRFRLVKFVSTQIYVVMVIKICCCVHFSISNWWYFWSIYIGCVSELRRKKILYDEKSNTKKAKTNGKNDYFSFE